jgi:histidinol dehydrogenase
VKTPRLLLRFAGSLRDLGDDDRRALLDRSTTLDSSVRDRTAGIIAEVKARGDAALISLACELDGVSLQSIEVPMACCRDALDRTPRELRRAMERAATNIAAVARANLPSGSECEPEPGILIARIPHPIQRVGVYAPGGRAAYPTSVLMGVVPARVAGVGEVVLCSPPQRDGLPSPVVLAAAALAGVDRVFSVGGAGAISAMAFGTETIPRVDRIVGPGNAYVAEAKLQVTGVVAIDAPAGPSELLVIADESCDTGRIALEMTAQAEHDPRACTVAVVVGPATADAIAAALVSAILSGSTSAVAREALASRGAVIACETLDEAIELANAYAPEHLLVATRDDDEVVGRIRGAGTVFVGQETSVAFGDYITGANHVLPTGGLARAYSGLSVLDFIRWTTYQCVSASAASSIARDVMVFAEAEGLPGHALAARAAGGIR